MKNGLIGAATNLNKRDMIEKLIVGLGNLGKRYKNTRHNVGFIVVDQLAVKLIPERSEKTEYFAMDNKFNCEIFKFNGVALAKPQTFMNESGKAVSSISQYLNIPISNIYIVHDDLDIKLGEYKIQKGKGPKDHKGLNSIYEKLGTKDFWHVRIGVENRDKNVLGEEYVLQRFKEEELEIINKVIKQVSDDLLKRLKI